MQIINGDILDITEGIIIHQVNCQNRIGAGLSGQIIAKYPEVEKQYHDIFNWYPKEDIHGMVSVVPINNQLFVVNSFSQFYYGNGRKNYLCYTDYNKLIDNIQYVLNLPIAKEIKVYIPYGIGCSLAGGDWNIVYKRLSQLENNHNLYIVRK